MERFEGVSIWFRVSEGGLVCYGFSSFVGVMFYEFLVDLRGSLDLMESLWFPLISKKVSNWAKRNL